MGDYHWDDSWAQLPSDDHERAGWAHHGLALSRTGELLGFHAGRPELLAFSADGSLTRSAPCPVREAHGITLVETDGVEYVWIADNASKSVRQPDGSYGRSHPDTPGQAVRVALDGTLVQRLDTPPLPVYSEGVYSPTSVAVDESRHGGSGDIWVADGYGQSLVHRFAADGSYLGALTGEEDGAAGRFACPHSVFIDRRRDEPELYVADRSNARVQVYGLDGRFHRVFGEGYLNSPSAFARLGDDHLVIAELFARLTVLDADDRLVRYLGAGADGRPDRPGWPNALDETGAVTRAPLQAGTFNSPHGVAVDANGTIYVTEWLVGDRMVKLDGGV